jgi:drug/metabolite transporter (DMT)-like permease
MAFYNMLPVFGVLLGILVLREQVGWFHILGGLLVVLGGVASLLPNLRMRNISLKVN